MHTASFIIVVQLKAALMLIFGSLHVHQIYYVYLWMKDKATMVLKAS